MKLTDQQRKCIDALRGVDNLGVAALATVIGGAEAGVGRTAGSLVARGVVHRFVIDGHVHYRLAKEWR